MYQIKLDLGHTLEFSKEINTINLSLIESGRLLACRKESGKKLNDFLINSTDQIFKGRIQLYRLDAKILIVFKKISLGFVSVSTLQQLLNDLK